MSSNNPAMPFSEIFAYILEITLVHYSFILIARSTTGVSEKLVKNAETLTEWQAELVQYMSSVFYSLACLSLMLIAGSLSLSFVIGRILLIFALDTKTLDKKIQAGADSSYWGRLMKYMKKFYDHITYPATVYHIPMKEFDEFIEKLHYFNDQNVIHRYIVVTIDEAYDLKERDEGEPIESKVKRVFQELKRDFVCSE